MKNLGYLLVGVAVFVGDQATKAAVSSRVPEGGCVVLAPWFWLVHWHNRGGLWGSFQDLPPFWTTTVFLAVPLLGVGLLAYFFLKSTRKGDIIILSALLGAAAGNLTDRIRLGEVVDFLYFLWPGGPGWPAFNLSDAVLSCGIFLLLIRSLKGGPSEGDHAPHPLPDR